MCVYCSECIRWNGCNKLIPNKYIDANNCEYFLDTQDFDEDNMNDRWMEMSYKKFIGRKCSNSLEELEEELEKEE